MAASLYHLTFPPTVSLVRYIIYGLETAFWIIFILTNSVFLITLKQTRSVHKNLRIILANMSLDYFIVACTRLLTIYHQLSLEQAFSPEVFYVVTLVAFTGLTAKTASEVTLLIERFVSTIFASKYEKMKSKYISIGFALVPYLYPCITLPLLVTSTVGKSVFIPMPIIFNILSWIFTIILLKINKETYIDAYNNVKSTTTKLTLTQRYQTVENIRTLRAIVWFLVYSTISNAITVSFHTFNTLYFTYNTTDKELYAFCSCLWYMINPAVALLLPLPFLLKHDDIKKNFMTLLGRRSSTSYKTVTGLQINMNNDADTHFKNLRDLWMENEDVPGSRRKSIMAKYSRVRPTS